MKNKTCYCLLLLLYNSFIYAQLTPASLAAEQFERTAQNRDGSTIPDTDIQEIVVLSKQPLHLNSANAAALTASGLFTPLQVSNFIRYRQLFGQLLSIYELQAVPGWDAETIRSAMPYISVIETGGLLFSQKEIFTKGTHQLLLRWQLKPFPVAGEEDFQGSKSSLFMRYQYRFRNILQFGFTGDKDAGEQFFRGAQRKGFDFYSFHLFRRGQRLVQSLALGDFTVNLGQGLIEWQAPAFGKSDAVLNIKRESPVLRPYSSAGTSAFHRGAGITLQKNPFNLTLFASFRGIDGRLGEDSISGITGITSVSDAGYHRTENEIRDRNRLKQLAAGGNLSFRRSQWYIGFNAITYHFSLAFLPSKEPYARFNITGKQQVNYSMDYSYTWRNLHFFGEMAADGNKHTAALAGCLISVDAKADVSLVGRRISAAYRSLSGNAFIESNHPANEYGWYMALSLRPAKALRLEGYADFFRFPWLRYRVNGPAQGREYSLRVHFKPRKTMECYARYRYESKPLNKSDPESVIYVPLLFTRQSWRYHCSLISSPGLVFNTRIELVQTGREGGVKSEGYLYYIDAARKNVSGRMDLSCRFQYYETSTYDARIYAYERDVLYSVSSPAFFGKGFRYYINIQYDIMKERISSKDRWRTATVWLRWAQNLSGLASGEIKAQLLYNF
jgi:hypothetical protein